MTKRCFWIFLLLWLCFPVVAQAGALYSFDGRIDFRDKKLNVVLHSQEKGSASIQVVSTSEEHYKIVAKVNHLEISNFVLSTELEGAFEKVGEDNSPKHFYSGSFASRYSLINAKPVGEASGRFEVKEGRFYIDAFSWEGIALNGFVDLWAPRSVNFALSLDQVRLSDLSLILGCSDTEVNLSGLVSGQIKVSGFSDRLLLKGSLASYEGMIEDLKYDSFLLNFEGIYPALEIKDSIVSETDGMSFNLEGRFDLSGGCHLAKGMKALKTSPLIDQNELQREWTIKRKQAEGRSATTEFKYRLKVPNDATTSPKEEQDGILGIEHKIRF